MSSLIVLAETEAKVRRIWQDGKEREIRMTVFAGAFRPVPRWVKTRSLMPEEVAVILPESAVSMTAEELMGLLEKLPLEKLAEVAPLKFGIGLLDKDDDGQFWGLETPHRLVTAWRGMQILDRVKRIGFGVISRAYSAGLRQEEDDIGRWREQLKEALPELDDVREEVLSRKIPDEELERMLGICNRPDNEIAVDIKELQEEIRLGTIRETEQVRRAFEISARGHKELVPEGTE